MAFDASAEGRRCWVRVDGRRPGASAIARTRTSGGGSVATCGRRSRLTPKRPADALVAIKGALRKVGLQLEATKDIGEFVVIDRTERPSGN